MKTTVFSRLLLLAAIIGLALGFGACGGASEQATPTAQSTLRTASPAPETVEKGVVLYAQFNCALCHLPNGEGTGPSLGGLYGTERQLADGSTVLVDEAYLARSIADPNAQITKGYTPAVMAAAMMSYSTALNDPDTISALVAYLSALPATP